MTVVLMSSRYTEDDQLLWRAAIRRGWSVIRARGVQVPTIEDDEIVIYVEALYATIIAEKTGRQLPDIPEDWLVRLPYEFRKREICLTSLGEARELNERIFVKPPNDKSFSADVYRSGAELPEEFDDSMSVLVAEPVEWVTEYRCLCLDGVVKTLSPYLRCGEHAKHTGYALADEERESATEFATRVLENCGTELPRAVALDVGVIDRHGWAVVEANAAWGAGIYGCDPEPALDVIRYATIN